MKTFSLTCRVGPRLLFQKASIFVRFTFFIFPIEILKNLTSMQKIIIFFINVAQMRLSSDEGELR